MLNNESNSINKKTLLDSESSLYKGFLEDENLSRAGEIGAELLKEDQKNRFTGLGKAVRSAFESTSLNSAIKNVAGSPKITHGQSLQSAATSLLGDKIGDSFLSGVNLNNFSLPSSYDFNHMKPVDFEPVIPAARSTFPEVSLSSISPKSYWHQLVIIGNGFDLECGLRSDFGSFIVSRAAEFAKNDGDLGLQYTHTIWDVILQGLDDDDWCDIEKAIAAWVSPEDLTEGTSLSFQKAIHRFVDHNEKRTLYLDPSFIDKDLAVYLGQYTSANSSLTKKDLFSISRKDLRILERDFSRYLSHLLKDNGQYLESSGRLLSQMLAYDRPDETTHEIEESILSFNYTPAPPAFRDPSYRAKYVNIHGVLGKEIVFGIDGTNRMNDANALPFTKTYRIMSFDSLGTNTLVRRPSSSRANDLQTKVVKFYGHSLGDADYSYFQAIFDEIELYESDVKLVFFYRSYEAKGKKLSEEEVKEEMMNKVIKLLTAYGQTLDNKDHGKNLIHKLLLEGRLSIVLI